MFDLSITPEQYKELWWKALVHEVAKTKKCFTLAELEEVAKLKTGTAPTNFSRAALRYAPITATGITTKYNIAEPLPGRPAMYYCSTLL